MRWVPNDGLAPSRPLPIIINRQHLPGNRLPPSTFALVRFGGQVALTRFGGWVAQPTLKNGAPRGPATVADRLL